MVVCTALVSVPEVANSILFLLGFGVLILVLEVGNRGFGAGMSLQGVQLGLKRNEDSFFLI